MQRSKHRPNVLILGGGFAGISCAGQLSSQSFDVCLIDQKPHFEFLPNIHEILSGVKHLRDVRLNLADQMAALGHRFRQALVHSIAPEGKRITLDDGTALHYDYLVVALGAVDANYGVTGIDAHALSFKSAAQCDAIGQRLNELRASSKASRVTIIGGGITGVEALGEILRLGVPAHLKITLLEAQEQLLPNSSNGLDNYIRGLCEPYSVEFRCGEAAQRIRKKSVLLGSGESLLSDLTIWTGGPAPSPLLQQSGLARPASWAPVDDYLHSLHADEVFIAGDSADLPSALAKQAYHAIDMGESVGRNIEALSIGRRMQRYRPSPKPQLISFGGLGCIMLAGKWAAGAPVLSAGKEVVFEVAMAQLDRQAAPERARQLLKRGIRASDKLFWPTVMSPTALLRQKNFQVLG
ncbi:MAG: FAD-dependent oxidoreductase [Luminiphilus sp.]|nr:FAD-dependent oxidoreductase [Luminiphilus sp.]